MIHTLNEKESYTLLGQNCIGHLAFMQGKNPVVLPITYYYDAEKHVIISYSGEGFKIDAMRMHDLVCLQVEEIESVGSWKSVVLHGHFIELSGLDAKNMLHRFAEGVKRIIREKGEGVPQYIHEFSGKTNQEAIPVVYTIIPGQITGRMRS